MAFDSEVGNHKVRIDAGPEVGGQDSGPRPKPLLITALAGCTGMDVVSILKKMRVEFDSLDIEIQSEMSEEHPKTYTAMHIVYRFGGKELPREKIEKAINLSQDRYCGVSALFEKGLKLSHELELKEA